MEYDYSMERHYAVSKSGVLVHIKEAHNSKEDCFCPHCRCRMIKRCGNIRAWHFAHDYRFENEVNKECSYESYLHTYAKLRLKQWFEESQSIILHYNQPLVCEFEKGCIWKEHGDECSRMVEKTIDLKKYLTDCRLEETVHVGDERFRADLLWRDPNNSKNDILIEIKVTHECTQKKKESHQRIIEFEVHSEEDVEFIVANDIRESETVRFYGFSPENKVDEEMQSRYSLTKFYYYPSGKAFVGSIDCKTFKERKNALLEVTIKDRDIDIDMLPVRQRCSGVLSFGSFHNMGLALAKSKGYDVRNCYLCNHHHYNYDEGKLTCELKPDENCQASQAISCDKYVFDDNYYRKYIDEYALFSQNNLVNTYSKSEVKEHYKKSCPKCK